MTCPNDLDLSLGAAVTFDDNVWEIQAHQALTSVLLHHRISGDSVVAPIDALSPVGDQEPEPGRVLNYRGIWIESGSFQ